jgi:glycosyltransferase involved in cell wall biosynthesis
VAVVPEEQGERPPGARPDAPQVALVHDYLTQRGGAERVLLAMSAAFPGAPVYTSLHDPAETYEECDGVDVRVGPLNAVPLLRRNHRLALPLLAPAFSRMRIPADVVLCSSSGWAHGVRTEGRVVVYCHSPAKWLYAPDRYFAGGWSASRAALVALRRPLIRWDQAASRRAHRYLVNSTMVREWVQDVYGIDAEVLPPPYSLDPEGPQEPVPGVEPGFVLCVSRLMPYKNVDAVVAAFAALRHERLVVVGAGPLEARLRTEAGPNVLFLRDVPDVRLRWLYGACRGLVAAAYEDFGLTPVEAAAFGRPVAALRWGGFLDTVSEGKTGVFFPSPSASAVAAAVRDLVSTRWDERALRAHAEQYSPATFSTRLQRLVRDEAGRAA